ncbi:hypothetical protein C8R43DRAFT_1120201 [Mycena crocata]|nr:hypothetical protein C8R43DRAFT_1120201 [Mycena crocata]
MSVQPPSAPFPSISLVISQASFSATFVNIHQQPAVAIAPPLPYLPAQPQSARVSILRRLKSTIGRVVGGFIARFH